MAWPHWQQGLPQVAKPKSAVQDSTSSVLTADLGQSQTAKSVPAPTEPNLTIQASPLAESDNALRGQTAPMAERARADGFAAGTSTPAPGNQTLPAAPNTETFATATPNPVHSTATDPVSTFSVDIDTASYAIIRSSLNAGQLPPPDAVRIEEMVNHFPYTYPSPAADGPPFTNTVTVMPTPWNPGTQLVHIALQGRLPDTRPGSPALLNDARHYSKTPDTPATGELGFLRLRYKNPGQTTSNLIETPITPMTPGTEPTNDTRFAAAIAGWGQLLQASRYLNGYTYDQAIALATSAKGPDDYGYRAEAVTLMRLAQSLAHQAGHCDKRRWC